MRTLSIKLLVLSTAAVCLAALFILSLMRRHEEAAPIPLYTVNQPMLGSPDAPLQVVSFEDPICNACILFYRNHFQDLYENYIQKGLIHYTVYLVADLPYSSIVVQTLLCAANQSKESFFSLLNLYYANPPEAPTDREIAQELIKMASLAKLPLNLKTLASCQFSTAIQKQVLSNTDYGRILMGGVIRTPTIFVNGTPLVRPTYEELTKLLQKKLKKP